jgi:PhnB protein
MAVSPVPPGYHSVTPYLIIDGATEAIEWYQTVFDAKRIMQLDAPNHRIGHAEIEIGGSRIMLADQHQEIGAHAPASYGGSPVMLHLYAADADAVFGKAIGHGAVSLRDVTTQFYGDRSGSFKDPFGHTWHVATHVEDVSDEEIRSRMAAAHGDK